MQYAGDGHDHWHVRQMLTYHLWGSRGTLRTSKVGFCFFDTNLIDGAPPALAEPPGLHANRCAARRRRSSTRNGISVGWGDKYPWNFAYQWIDITGLPGGTYTLRVAVDLYGYFTETIRDEQLRLGEDQVRATGEHGDGRRPRLGLRQRPRRPRRSPPTSPGRASAGISNGCDADMFCTNNPMTRGEVADLHRRAFRYPAATQDYFTDDDGNANEADINRIAEAGLTPRLRPGQVLPDQADAVTGQVASLLARALASAGRRRRTISTTTTGPRSRTTSTGSPRPGSPRAAACAGLSQTAESTRGQLVAMLHRASVPEPRKEEAMHEPTTPLPLQSSVTMLVLAALAMVRRRRR